MNTIKDIIEQNGITMESVRIPARTDAGADNFDSTASHFLCTISCNSESMQIPYSMGSAHAFDAGKKEALKGSLVLRGFPQGTTREDIERAQCTPFGRVSLHQEEVRKNIIRLGNKVLQPELADVIDCLASDYCGYVNSRCFEDWASEYGYDTDSRKAEKIYDTVRQQSMATERVFGRELAEKLAFDTERL